MVVHGAGACLVCGLQDKGQGDSFLSRDVVPGWVRLLQSMPLDWQISAPGSGRLPECTLHLCTSNQGAYSSSRLEMGNGFKA